jgi:hypothetical protein
MQRQEDQAAQRKALVSRRRREEAQLRMLWEQAVERGHALQLRIAENDRQLASLGTQAERAAEEQAAELHQAQTELLRWTRRVDEGRRAAADRMNRLDALERNYAALEHTRSITRLQLISNFIPHAAASETDFHSDEIFDEPFAAVRETFLDAALAADIADRTKIVKERQTAASRAALQASLAELRELSM